MIVTWRARFGGWRRAHGRISARSSLAARLPIASASKTSAARDAAPAEVADFDSARQISEADLHGYIDGDLGRATDDFDVEAFLAAHPLIADRLEAYRSQTVAVNAAFRAGEMSLPPPLAQLASRYARAVRASSRIGATLGVIGLVALLCVVAETARGACG